MRSASPSQDELNRVKAVEEFERLSTGERDALDDIANLASRICKTPISLVTFITKNEQLIRGARGLDIEKTTREVAFCSHTIESDYLFEVEDAQSDRRFSGNPLVTGDPNIRFYAGMPLVTPHGERVGSLCVIDNVPRRLSETQSEALSILAEQVMKRLELNRTQRQLSESYDALSRISVLRTRLLNVLAHDVRSPLSSLKVILELLEEGELTAEERKDFLRNMSAVMDQTDALIQNILDWGKVTAVNESFNITKVSVSEIVEDTLELVNAQASIKRIEIVDETKGPIDFELDANVFRLVLRNLLNNAIKYSKGGATVRIRTQVDLEGLSLEVSDQGSGMSREQMDSLFQGGVASSIPGTDGEKGTGLGLVFVKDMLDKCGGTINVRSNSDGGCTFVAKFHVPSILI